jgi:hypothetical protein
MFFEDLNILICTLVLYVYALVIGGFRYYFTESQAASCKHFQRQNRRFRVFEAGYWKDFQN